MAALRKPRFVRRARLRGGAAARAMASALAAAWLVLQLAALVHQAYVPHQTCAVHGAESHVTLASSRVENAQHFLAQVAGEDEGALHTDEHCGAAANAGAPSGSARAQATRDGLGDDAVGPGGGLAAKTARVPLWAVAPKQSPPASS